MPLACDLPIHVIKLPRVSHMAPMATQEYGVQEITSADMTTTLSVASIEYDSVV